MRASSWVAVLLTCSCMPDYAALRGRAGNKDAAVPVAIDAEPVDGGLTTHDLQGADVPLGGDVGIDGAAGRGGATSGGGATGSGGTLGRGGAEGTTATGGMTGSGGATGAGGTTLTGGIVGSGGITAPGGAVGAGGTTTTGGTVGAGGTTTTGGTMATGGRTGSGGTTASGGKGGAGGSTCAVVTAGPFLPLVARSGGFQGDGAAYTALEQQICTRPTDCTPACQAAGGTPEFCLDGMRCGTVCSPPSYWYPDFGAGSGGTPLPYRVDLIYSSYHDPLILSDFGVQVPADATITGVQFQIARYVLAAGPAVSDYSVRVLQNGQAVGVDHKRSETWSANGSVPVSYGGVSDLWGVAWTPESVMSSRFGMSIAGLYNEISGNMWLFVTDARASVSYVPAHCP